MGSRSLSRTGLPWASADADAAVWGDAAIHVDAVLLLEYQQCRTGVDVCCGG